MPIENISDTARWVAVYRAMETERPDAHFRDPYARRLAGDRGEEIVRGMKRGRQMAWAMIVRTQVFDEEILRVVGEGADLVLNLAAGLDARPWRLDLPGTLRWVDVDLPAILEHKTSLMRGERPKCRYEAVTLDLADRAARRALFAKLAAEAKRVLVVTEGLLIYLTAEQVGELADDLHAAAPFRKWVIDLAHPDLLKMMTKMWGSRLEKGNAPFRFAPPEGTAFFAPHGWRELTFRASMEEARRLKREMPGSWIFKLMMPFYPKHRREIFRRFSGTVVLERT
jgi:methyltransferase (TIGR00027 family)